MDILFENYEPYHKYKHILDEPLEADISKYSDVSLHRQHSYYITNYSINHVDKLIKLKDQIECLFFMYVENNKEDWTDKYWFFVGKLTNGIYFTYQSNCSGTGFGLGEDSHIYLSKNTDLLCRFGFTNKQRDLIEKYILYDRFYILK